MEGTITSPNYPDTYPDMNRCTYIITVDSRYGLRLFVEELQVRLNTIVAPNTLEK